MTTTLAETRTVPFEAPTIDISPYRSNTTSEAAHKVVDAVKAACTDVGFFQIVGHGVPRNIQDDAFKAAAAFFALPQEEKMKLDKTKPGAAGKGYEIMGTQEQERGLGGDTKEVNYLLACGISIITMRISKYVLFLQHISYGRMNQC